MVTEYIKRNQKMGYDEKGNLLYKVPADETATEIVEPVIVEAPVVEDTVAVPE